MKSRFASASSGVDVCPKKSVSISYLPHHNSEDKDRIILRPASSERNWFLGSVSKCLKRGRAYSSVQKNSLLCHALGPFTKIHHITCLQWFILKSHSFLPVRKINTAMNFRLVFFFFYLLLFRLI